jgi:AcrR family transcriptional regulator
VGRAGPGCCGHDVQLLVGDRRADEHDRRDPAHRRVDGRRDREVAGDDVDTRSAQLRRPPRIADEDADRLSALSHEPRRFGPDLPCCRDEDIADTAARLFAEHGYEHVSVGDVAREAEVAEQTIYNYFGTKERLVTDRDEQIQDRLCDLIRTRPAGTTAAAAIRPFVLASITAIRSVAPDVWRGELGHLAAISPTVHRLALELIDRQAAALADAVAVADSTAVSPEIARLHGIALAGVFQIIISEAGRRTRESQSQTEIADELSSIVENVLEELHRWLSTGQFRSA